MAMSAHVKDRVCVSDSYLSCFEAVFWEKKEMGTSCPHHLKLGSLVDDI